jgi:hypothetical protein
MCPSLVPAGEKRGSTKAGTSHPQFPSRNCSIHLARSVAQDQAGPLNCAAVAAGAASWPHAPSWSHALADTSHGAPAAATYRLVLAPRLRLSPPPASVRPNLLLLGFPTASTPRSVPQSSLCTWWLTPEWCGVWRGSDDDYWNARAVRWCWVRCRTVDAGQYR